jgi:hypothetical protein
MGIFDWLLGPDDGEPDWPRPPPIPSKAGVGPDIDVGRVKTKTEKDLRRVKGEYDPDSESFDPTK